MLEVKTLSPEKTMSIWGLAKLINILSAPPSWVAGKRKNLPSRQTTGSKPCDFSLASVSLPLSLSLFLPPPPLLLLLPFTAAFTGSLSFVTRLSDPAPRGECSGHSDAIRWGDFVGLPRLSGQGGCLMVRMQACVGFRGWGTPGAISGATGTTSTLEAQLTWWLSASGSAGKMRRRQDQAA